MNVTFVLYNGITLIFDVEVILEFKIYNSNT